MLKVLEGQDLIVALGNTGCGKSTIFQSLVFGASHLESKLLEHEFELVRPDGAVKTKKAKRMVVQEKESNSQLFRIGHSTCQSETFFPSFQKVPDSDITFVDIAGFQDTSGVLIEFVNCFIAKLIFLKAKTIRFLVPITYGQVHESRGGAVRDQVELLENIFQANIGKVINAIQPLLTKCNPKNDVNIDQIRGHVDQQLKQKMERDRRSAT